MKLTRLLNLLAAFILFLGTVPVAHTVEPLNTLNDAEPAESPPLSLFSDPSAPSAVQSLPENWHIECVDCPKQFGGMTDRSLRMDGQGHPHIAYGKDHLYYAWHDGTQWHYETVDKSPLVGWYASLALDGLGRPHIGYYDRDNHDLKYAWHDGIDWQIETVDSEGSVGGYTSLVLDGSDWPHISYYDGNNHDLKYAWYDGTQWRYETVNDSSGAGRYPGDTSLALDGLDRPHISYYDNSPDCNLKYAWHDGTAWQIETVDNSPEANGYPGYISLVLDGSEQAHISYFDAANGDLKYAWHDGAVWQIETVDNVGVWGGSTSLALDEAGQPHISYYDDINADLKYAWHDGVTWQIETVDSDGWVGRYTSLALDESGWSHISYYDYTNRALKYAWYNGTDWQIEMVDSAGNVGMHTSLALDDSDQPHISYYDQTNDDLKYAWYDGMTWHIEVVNSAGDVDPRSSLALDRLGRPHISYFDATNVDLKYAWHDGTAWQVETTESAGDESRYTGISLALDGLDRPHISYHDFYPDSDSSDLKHAWHDGTAWQIETVDNYVYWSMSTSLALDESSPSHPHISYSENGHLKYAWHDGTAWQIETVDSDGWVGRYTSLTLDGAGWPHISYSENGLKYAWHDGTAWQIETVDSEGPVGEHSSLALNSLDRPHIGYVDGINGKLKYAWHDGIDWQIETVDSKGGIYISLALDEASRPHISYDTNGDLKYARLVRAPLFLDKQVVPDDELQTNDILTFTLTLLGLGVDVHLWDPLPDTIKYITDTLTPPAVYSPTVNAVVWQGTLPTDTVQVVQFQATPRIVGAGALSAPIPIANIAWLTDTESGATISATVSVTVTPGHLFLDKQATPRGSLHNDDTLTYTLTFSGSGQTARLWDPLPVNVYCITDSITSTVTPAAVYSPTARAIIWEGTLPTDTAQVIQFQATPHITGTGALVKPILITNTAWLTVTTGVESSRNVSATTGITVTPSPLFLDKQATPRDGLRNDDTLTYTLTLSGSGQTARLWDPLPASVYYITDSITSTLTPSAVYISTTHAIVWEGTLLTDTVQVARFQVTPGISGTEPLSLSQPIINTAWLTVTAGVESGRSVSDMVIVNGWRLYLPLMYPPALRPPPFSSSLNH